MNTSMRCGAMHAYKTVDTYSGVESADPHGLITLLANAALDKLSAAKGHITREQSAEKGGAISKTIAILDELRVSLNKEAGGAIAANLEDLYDYMQRRLVEANLRNDASILDEVASLMREIRDAWLAIPEEAR